MKKTLSAILAVLLAALLCACGNTAPASKSESSVSTITSSAASEEVSKPTDEEAHENGYPKIEELVWSFRNTVKYDEPVAVFDYTNNSDYTIVMLELYFKMKEGVTSKQLQLIDRMNLFLMTKFQIWSLMYMIGLLAILVKQLRAQIVTWIITLIRPAQINVI